jgi:hypothetical protein
MWGINLQLGGGRLGFVFKGLSGVSGERVLTVQESLGRRLGFVAFPGPEGGTWDTRHGGPLTFITPFLHMEVPAFLITNKSLGHGGELYTGKVGRRFVISHP